MLQTFLVNHCFTPMLRLSTPLCPSEVGESQRSSRLPLSIGYFTPLLRLPTLPPVALLSVQPVLL